MSAIRRRGAELRAVVRRRRRVRRIVVVAMAANVLMLSVLLTREPGDLSGLLLVALVTAAVVLLHLAALLLPTWERRTIRREITGEALTRAQSRRWALVGALVGAGASIVAVSMAGMLDSWTTGAAIAAPILLMTILWAACTLKEGQRSSEESTTGDRPSEPR